MKDLDAGDIVFVIIAIGVFIVIPICAAVSS